MTLRIVVLDGHTANPGDLSWAALERLKDEPDMDRVRELDRKNDEVRERVHREYVIEETEAEADAAGGAASAMSLVRWFLKLKLLLDLVKIAGHAYTAPTIQEAYNYASNTLNLPSFTLQLVGGIFTGDVLIDGGAVGLGWLVQRARSEASRDAARCGIPAPSCSIWY